MKRIILSLIIMCLGATSWAQETLREGRHKGVDYGVTTGTFIGLKGSGVSFPIELYLGKRFNKTLYTGIGSGVWVGSGSPFVPVTGTMRFYMPTASSSTAFINISGSYALNTASGEVAGYKVDVPDAAAFEVAPGVSFSLSRKCDLLLSVGYRGGFVVGETVGTESKIGHSIVLRAAINIHDDVIPNRVRNRPRKPVRTKGMVFGIEGGALLPGDNVVAEGNISLGYKFNPYFSASLGFDYNGPTLRSERQTIGMECRESSYDDDYSASRFAPFLRAEYRALNKRLSPIVGCDFGFGITMLSNRDANNNWDDENFSITKTGVFARPFIGLSCRISANSYLDLKGGYSVSQQMSHKFHTDRYWHSYKPAGFTGAFFALGFKRTLKWLSK